MTATAADVHKPPKPPCDREHALAVLDRLRGSGHEAYFAGGCVRDLLLGRDPKDWDVATNAPPNRVRQLFSHTQAVGAAFGVILVRQGASVVEVATFRADGAYADGRRPNEVRFTTAEEDARRRDFTINGLFLDPHAPGAIDRQIIDYVGGKHDLAARQIRAIGQPEERFDEDHLRMLRAVRFAARFNFDIEPGTAKAIRHHADRLVRISPERIAEELRMMLTPASRSEAYWTLDDLGLRSLIFRFLELPHGPGRAAKATSVFSHLDSPAGISFSLALAGATLDHYLWTGPANANVRRLFEKPIAAKIVRALRQSLKLSNEESDGLAGTLEGLDPLLTPEQPRLAMVKRFLARASATDSRLLLAAAHRAGLLDGARVDWLESELRRYEVTVFAPHPLVTGDDLTAAGLAPGPIFKRVLDTVYDAQLEDRVATRDEAMDLALRTAKASE